MWVDRDQLSRAYIATFLAASILHELKEEYSNVDCYCFDVDIPQPPVQPTPQESMEGIMRALIKYLPEYTEVVASTSPGYEYKMLELAKELSPQQAQLAADLFEKYGPIFNEIGNRIMQQNALAKAASDVAVMGGPGMELVARAREAERTYDPVKEAARELILQKANELANSFSASPTGSELAEMERLSNRQSLARGVSNAPSQTETLRAATEFGNMLNQRKLALSQALQSAAAITQALTKPVDVFSVATGRPVMVNPGESRYLNPNLNPYSNTLGITGSMFNALTGLQEAAMGNTASMYGSYASAMSRRQSPFASIASGLQSLGGFLWGSEMGPLTRTLRG